MFISWLRGSLYQKPKLSMNDKFSLLLKVLIRASTFMTKEDCLLFMFSLSLV